jgi:hypothetical protein
MLVVLIAVGCGEVTSTNVHRSSDAPRTSGGAGSGGALPAPANGGSISPSNGGAPSVASGGSVGVGGGSVSPTGGRSSIDGGDASVAPGSGGAGGTVEPPAACDPLIDGGTLFSNRACGTIQPGNLPPAGPLPYDPSGPVALPGVGVVTLREGASGAFAVDLFDVSGKCRFRVGVEEHSFNKYVGVVGAGARAETVAALVGCGSDSGPCGSTLYVNGKVAIDMTEYPPNPLVSVTNRIAVDPDGNVLIVTDSAPIARDISHRVRLVSRAGVVLKDATLPADRFFTIAVAADRQGRYVIAMVGQPVTGGPRSTLQVIDHNLVRLSYAPLREDIEVAALWADSADTGIAVGQEGSPDPYGYVEAFSIPSLARVWANHPRLPLGYARAVDVAKTGLVWVAGYDPNDALWLASYDPSSKAVSIAPMRPAPGDYRFANWSLAAQDDGTVLIAHDSLYSYCP